MWKQLFEDQWMTLVNHSDASAESFVLSAAYNKIIMSHQVSDAEI